MVACERLDDTSRRALLQAAVFEIFAAILRRFATLLVDFCLCAQQYADLLFAACALLFVCNFQFKLLSEASSLRHTRTLPLSFQMAQQLGDVAAEQKQKAASAQQQAAQQQSAYAPYAAAALDECAHFNGLMRGPTASSASTTAASAGDAPSTSTASSNHSSALRSYIDQLPKDHHELKMAAAASEQLRQSAYAAAQLSQTSLHSSAAAAPSMSTAKSRVPNAPTPTSMAYRAYAPASSQQTSLPTSGASASSSSSMSMFQMSPGFNGAVATAGARNANAQPPPPSANTINLYHRASSMTPIQQAPLPPPPPPQPSLLQHQISTGGAGGLPPNGVAWSQYQAYDSIWR